MRLLTYRNEHVHATADQARSWSATSVGPTLHLTGECPACGHQSSIDVPLITTELERARHGDGAGLTVSLRCTCDEPHKERPPGAGQGCGRSWEFTVATSGDGALAITPALDPLLVAAAEVLREEAPKQLDILRAAAEKWIGGIVALYTLFGLASISIAKDSIAPLPTVARIAVALLVLIALTQAAFAVYCAYRGAYGLPVIHQVNNDDELREWYQQRAAAPSRVAHFVKRAVAAALGSLAALTLAVGVIWLTTPKDVLGPVVKLTMRDDSQACGTLLPTTSPDASGALRLRRADDGSVLQLPAGGFKAITPVKAC